MRKLLWIIFVIPVVAHAQFKKGNAYLGVRLWRDNGYTSFNVSPFVGFFINPRTALGASVVANSSQTESEYTSNDGTKHTQHSKYRYATVTATGRRYYPLADKFYFALQGEVYYLRSHSESNDDIGNNAQNNFYGLGTLVKPLFVYFPRPRWGLEAGLGQVSFSFSKDLTNGTKTNAVALDLGKVTLGFAYYFGK